MATPDEMKASMLANLEVKTGRTLEGWLETIGGAQLEKHGEIVAFLKNDHGVTHGFASMLAHQALASSSDHLDDDELVAAQYAGPKAGLRAIYERLLEEARSLGSDVEVSPKKAYVSLRRARQFATIKPATRTRVDVGIQLRGDEPTARLELCRPGSMTTHLVRLELLDEVDDELIGWMEQAYLRAG